MVVEDLVSLSLAPDDARHLSSVLRLKDGEAVGATDGRGGYVACRYSGSGRLTASGPVAVTPRPAPALTVGFVPVKGDRPEWAVQKLTELGVDRIVLLSSDRSVVRWEGSRLESHLGRLRRVARSAVMQSRQLWLPEISGVVPLAAVLSPAAAPSYLAVADMGGGPVRADVHTILIGPEGGWSDAERDLFARSATPAVSFGPSVLRAETAAVTAGALMTALRAGVVAPAPAAG